MQPFNEAELPPPCTGWAELNRANAGSFVVVKHVLENFDNFWQVK